MNKTIIAGLGILVLLSVLVSGYHGSVGWTDTALLASLVAFVVKFGLALWIYLRNPYARVNRTFAVVFFGQAVWDLGKFAMWMTHDASLAFIFARVSYSGYIISVFFMLDFVWAYLKRKNFFTSAQGRVVLYTPMLFMLAALWFTPTVISGMVSPDALPYGFGIELWDYEYGPVYNYFFLWFQIIPFIYAFVLFVVKYFTTHHEDKKKQIFYLVVGSAFPIMIGIPTGVILPAMGLSLPPHNNLLSLIMSVFIAVGIIKYKFLSVQPVSEPIVPGRRFEKSISRDYLLKQGHSHLIKQENADDVTYDLLLSQLYQRRYGLIITPHNPSKIRHEYDIQTTPIVWLTDTETEHLAIDPIDIAQLYETIRKFIKRVPNSVILIDGIDYLVAHNNFAKVLHFIRQVKQSIARSDDCLIVTKGELALDPKHERLFDAEFILLPKQAAMRAEKKLERKAGARENYVIIGHTPLSQSVISELERKGVRPTVVEKNDILVHYPKSTVNIIKGEPLSSKVLMHAGINRPNTIVLITLENDSEIILCINKIRQLSDSAKIITNIHNQDFISIALKAGADKIIPSSAIGGRLISLALTAPEVVRWVMDATTMAVKDLDLTEVRVENGSAFRGKTINMADRMLLGAGNIIAVMNVEGLKQIPDNDYALQEGDRLIVVINLTVLPRGKTTSDRVNAFIKKRK
jgi:Trk K+ transport system NAD-binding subunit